MATLGLGRGRHVNLVCVLMDPIQIVRNDNDVGCKIHENIIVLVWQGLKIPYCGVENRSTVIAS